MLTQRYFERDGSQVLLRLAIHEAAVFDILTTDAALEQARNLLASAHFTATEGDSVALGTFGIYSITLSLLPEDDSVTILIDGPNVGQAFRGDQTAGFYLSRRELLDALDPAKEFPAGGAQLVRMGRDT